MKQTNHFIKLCLLGECVLWRCHQVMQYSTDVEVHKVTEVKYQPTDNTNTQRQPERWAGFDHRMTTAPIDLDIWMTCTPLSMLRVRQLYGLDLVHWSPMVSRLVEICPMKCYLYLDSLTWLTIFLTASKARCSPRSATSGAASLAWEDVTDQTMPLMSSSRTHTTSS